MKFEAVTIKDIAKALGLSTSTVSRALRDSYEISPETKKLVLEYAQKINYHPNPIALSLKERKSHTIGILVEEIANSFFSQIIDGVESVAHQKGYNIIISQSHKSAEAETKNLQYLTSRSIDGLIVSVSTENENFDYYTDLIAKGMPLVFFDRVINEIDTHKVIVDNYKGAYEATTHLIRNGCRAIATLANVQFLSITKERVAGYKQALADNDIPFREELVYHCQPGKDLNEEAATAVQQLLALPNRPDAILGLSDKLTTGCLRAFKKAAVSIPRDMQLIGFSNNDLTDLLEPALSIIKQPAFEMGAVATQLLLQLIESKRPVTEFEKRVLSPELIIRDSSPKKRKEKV